MHPTLGEVNPAFMQALNPTSQIYMPAFAPKPQFAAQQEVL